jgi:ABC-type transporter Mla MlaB component
MLTFKVSATENDVSLSLSGAVDEHAAAPLRAAEKAIKDAQRVTIECEGITTMNSIGVATWSTFLQTAAKSAAVELHRCPVVLVELANIVPVVFAHAEVVSFYLPLRCTPCGTSTSKLVKVADVGTRGIDLTKTKCAKCGSTKVEAEVDIEAYVEFLGSVDEAS